MFVGDGDPCHKHLKCYWTDHATKNEMMKLNFENYTPPIVDTQGSLEFCWYRHRRSYYHCERLGSMEKLKYTLREMLRHLKIGGKGRNRGHIVDWLQGTSPPVWINLLTHFQGHFCTFLPLLLSTVILIFLHPWKLSGGRKGGLWRLNLTYCQRGQELSGAWLIITVHQVHQQRG